MSEAASEILLARLILEERKFKPGDNLEHFVSEYADIEYDELPFGDGLVLDIKSHIKPTIILNEQNPPSRRNFTLAHEFGHVVIPWHIGNIVSQIDDDSTCDYHYREMEAEANRFASEFLMPSQWCFDLFQSNKDPAVTLECIVNICGVSAKAAIIKLMQILPRGFICLESDSDSNYEVYESPKTLSRRPSLPEGSTSLDKVADARFEINLKKYKFIWWYLEHEIALPNSYSDSIEWREPLKDILASIDSGQVTNLRSSLNGIISVAFTRHKNIHNTYADVINRLKGSRHETVISHPRFNDFLIAKLHDLTSKTKSH